MNWFKRQNLAVKIIIIFALVVAFAGTVGMLRRVEVDLDNLKGNWVVKDNEDKNNTYMMVIKADGSIEKWNIAESSNLISKGTLETDSSKIVFEDGKNISITGMIESKIHNSNNLSITKTPKTPLEYSQYLNSEIMKDLLNNFKKGGQWFGKFNGEAFLIEVLDSKRFDQIYGKDYSSGNYEIDYDKNKITFKYKSSGDIYGLMQKNGKIDIYSRNDKYYTTLENNN